MAKSKMNSDEILHLMIEKAGENGYSLIVNGTKNEELHIALYPFRSTIVSQEEMARQLYAVMQENKVTETQESLDKFRRGIEPDDLDEFIFTDDSGKNVHVSVFHNKNILLKHIIMKI